MGLKSSSASWPIPGRLPNLRIVGDAADRDGPTFVGAANLECFVQRPPSWYRPAMPAIPRVFGQIWTRPRRRSPGEIRVAILRHAPRERPGPAERILFQGQEALARRAAEPLRAGASSRWPSPLVGVASFSASNARPSVLRFTSRAASSRIAVMLEPTATTISSIATAAVKLAIPGFVFAAPKLLRDDSCAVPGSAGRRGIAADRRRGLPQLIASVRPLRSPSKRCFQIARNAAILLPQRRGLFVVIFESVERGPTRRTPASCADHPVEVRTQTDCIGTARSDMPLNRSGHVAKRADNIARLGEVDAFLLRQAEIIVTQTLCCWRRAEDSRA